MKRTTLYNHKAIEKDGKPLIPNIVYKSLLWLAENKFYQEAEYLKASYTLEAYQLFLYQMKMKPENTLPKLDQLV